MSAVALRGPNPDMVRDLLGSESAQVRARSDAQLDVREIQALRLEADMVVGPEAATLAEPLVALYRGTLTSGDHLRLPQLTTHDGPSMRAAVGRVLAVNTRATGGGTSADVIKEERMRRVLHALDELVGQIQRQASLTSR